MLLISFKQTLNRVLRSPAVRSAFFAFTLTRAIVLGTLLLAVNAHHDGQGPAFGRPVEEVTISLREGATIRRLAEAVNVADGLWYMNIARNGYEKQKFNLDQQHSWA